MQRSLAFAFVLAFALQPAFAADAPSRPPGTAGRELPRLHPEAAKINQRNATVVHAGPGTPLSGAVHVPPAQAKKAEK
jgi:hypothetical protein